MLSFSPWKIEQTSFAPSQEADIDRQLAFSNGYISQYASFEELYTGEQASGTWLKGVAAPLPPVISLSVHLHDELLDLNRWQVLSFYRCLHRQQPLLERRFSAVSPNGNRLNVRVKRLLSLEDRRLMTIEYQLTSDNYDGPASFLAFLGSSMPFDDWFPLERSFRDTQCKVLLQHLCEDVKVAVTANCELIKNDEPLFTR